MRGKLSLSIMCMGLEKIEKKIKLFENKKIEYLHIDVMDGEFVSNLAIGTDYVKQLRKITSISFDFHFMVINPLKKLKMYDILEKDIVTIHIENNSKIKECIKYIKKIGAKCFLAIKPETCYKVLNKYLDLIDGILVMTVNPGFIGKPLVPETINKVGELKKYLEQKQKSNILISVDGNITMDYATLFYKLGANIFIAGSSSIFQNQNKNLNKLINKKRKMIGW